MPWRGPGPPARHNKRGPDASCRRARPRDPPKRKSRSFTEGGPGATERTRAGEPVRHAGPPETKGPWGETGVGDSARALVESRRGRAQSLSFRRGLGTRKPAGAFGVPDSLTRRGNEPTLDPTSLPDKSVGRRRSQGPGHASEEKRKGLVKMLVFSAGLL